MKSQLKLSMLVLTVLLSACAQKKLSSSVKNRYLYWASASNCFTGITTPPAHLLGINVVARMPLEGGPIELVWDYSIEPHGEQEIPVGLDFDDTSKTLLVSVEGPVRRIDFIDVTSKSRLRFIQNSSFNSQLRSLALFEAGNILISRSAAIELFTSSGNRLTLGANPWVNNPQGACTGSNTQILRVLTTPQGHILYVHPHTTATSNKMGAIRKTGYSAATDCLGSFTYPANFLPSQALFVNDQRLLVTTVGTNPTSHSRIDSVDVTFDDNTSNYTFSNLTTLLNDPSLIQTPTSFVYDEVKKMIYVATFNDSRIKALEYDETNNELTYKGILVKRSYLTKCIAHMKIIEH